MSYVVTLGNVRIDKYLMNETGFSRNHLQKLIENGMVIVNGKAVKASYLVKENDIIEIMDVSSECSVEAENIPLDIVYEDEYLLVVNTRLIIVNFNSSTVLISNSTGSSALCSIESTTFNGNVSINQSTILIYKNCFTSCVECATIEFDLFCTVSPDVLIFQIEYTLVKHNLFSV